MRLARGPAMQVKRGPMPASYKCCRLGSRMQTGAKSYERPAAVDQHASFAVLPRTAISARTSRSHSAKTFGSNAVHNAHSASQRLIFEAAVRSLRSLRKRERLGLGTFLSGCFQDRKVRKPPVRCVKTVRDC